MEQHKHCRKCGVSMVSPVDDEELSDVPPNDATVFQREIYYRNGFCAECALEYGIDRLVTWFYRGEKI